MVVGLPLPLCATIDGPEQLVQYDHGALTVRLVRASRADVLGKIALETGADIHGNLREPGEVTATFDGLPLRDALQRVLGGQSFSLKYLRSRVRAIELLPNTANSAAAETYPAPTVTAEAIPMSSTAGLPEVLQAALQEKDDGVRTQTMGALWQHIQSNDALRASILPILSNPDAGAGLAATLRSMYGDRGDELARYILSHGR